ncbi:hypothetical protein GQX74_013103 [Glossina fuscipes]|nr:hypothetical protein GQX74_013103 [Glossina fuscipes]
MAVEDARLLSISCGIIICGGGLPRNVLITQLEIIKCPLSDSMYDNLKEILIQQYTINENARAKFRQVLTSEIKDHGNFLIYCHYLLALILLSKALSENIAEELKCSAGRPGRLGLLFL